MTHIDASTLTHDQTLSADVVIIGSGAGGGTAAEILAMAGKRVIIVEEGPYRTRQDFTLTEKDAYPDLYQDAASRKTKDHGICIYQGRTVGGSTTVNWTTSFRTPAMTLDHWAKKLGITGLSAEDLAPYFKQMEERLHITPWDIPANPNNQVIQRGADKLGISYGTIARNVKGCANLGYCGLGCPLDAKQSMLVTTIPKARDHGATVVSRARALSLRSEGDRITEVECAGMGPSGPMPYKLRIQAQAFVLAAGAIGSPAILLRSRGLNPYGNVGTRTFLHPVVVAGALMPDLVQGFAGAPQSIYSDHYLTPDFDGPVGFKLEVPPLQPLLVATNIKLFGHSHRRIMTQFPHMHAMIALLRDGFHPESPGGTVGLNSSQLPILDYPMTSYLWDGVRRAFRAMVELQFAAGAKEVFLLHSDAQPFTQVRAATEAIAKLRLEILRTKVLSAHVMGGCAMGAAPQTSVVTPEGQHHERQNLFVFDGSVFPTSIGANPQLSIYGLVARNASYLAKALK